MFNARKPYGTVSGTGVAGAVYMQDGQYYDVSYRYLFSNPGVDAPKGETRRSMEQAEAEFQARLKARERGEVFDEPPRAERKSAPAVPPVPPLPQGEGEGELSKEQQLMQLNVPRLQELQLAALKALNEEQPEAQRKNDKELRAEVIKGPGAKERLVKWLAENTAAE